MKEELKLAKDIGYDKGFAKGFFLGVGVAFISCIISLVIVEKQRFNNVSQSVLLLL